MLSSSDFGPIPGDAPAARDARAATPHTALLAEALRQWFGVAVGRIHRGQRAELVFREAIDMACSRAHTDGIPIERLIVAVRASLVSEVSALSPDQQGALIDTIVSHCIERFYRDGDERTLDSRDD